MIRTSTLVVKRKRISKGAGLHFALLLSLLSHVAILYFPITFGGILREISPATTHNQVLDVSIVQLTAPEMSSVEPLITWPIPSKPLTINRFADDVTPMVPDSKNGIADPKYYPASELDMLPKAQQEINLYTEEILQADLSGELVIRLWLNENGSVEKVEVIKSELPEMFVTTAINGFNRAVFSPAKKQGRAVKARLDIGWVFSGS